MSGITAWAHLGGPCRARITDTDDGPMLTISIMLSPDELTAVRAISGEIEILIIRKEPTDG